MTGIGGASRPLAEREQERPRLSERLSPAPPQVGCLWVSPRRRRVLVRSSRFHPINYNGPHVSWQSPPQAGRNLMAAGSDDERSQGGRHVPNDAPTVPSSVLDQDIAGRQHHLRAIVKLECHIAGEEDPEIRRVGPMKAVVSSAGFVAILELHLGSGFWCNHAGQVRPYDVADATYGWEYTGRRRIVPRVRVGCGLIGIPEEAELSYSRDGHPIDLLVSHKNSATLGVAAVDNLAYLHSVSFLVRLVHGHVLG